MSTFIRKTFSDAKNVYNRILLYKSEHPRIAGTVSVLAFIVTMATAGMLFYRPLLNAFRLSLNIGWKFYLVPVLFLIWNTVATYGWKGIVDALSDVGLISLGRLYTVRIEGLAINTVLPFSGVGSEVLRSARLSERMGFKRSVGSVTIDKVLDLISGAAFALSGALLLATADMHSVTGVASLCIYTAFCFLLVLYLPSVWTFLIRHWPRFAKDGEMSIERGKPLGNALRRCFVAHFVEHTLIAAEIVMIAGLLDIRIGVRDMLVLNTLLTVSELVFMAVPGKIGSVECSMALGFSMLSMPVEAGLSVAIIRRARQLLIGIAGLILLFTGRKKTESTVRPAIDECILSTGTMK